MRKKTAPAARISHAPDVTPSRPLRSYDLAAAWYDRGAHLYSGGAIAASKAAQLDAIAAGDRVLYLGVGTGAEAAAACERGAVVTAVDTSAKMLDRLRERPHGAGAELILGDALAHRRPNFYDAVAANYFLNLFPPDAMRAALRHAVALTKPGGRLLIADLAPPRGGVLNRAVNGLYSKAAMSAFRALRLCAWHPNYDYAAECRALGLTIEREAFWRPFGLGPELFTTVVARKAGRYDDRTLADEL